MQRRSILAGMLAAPVAIAGGLQAQESGRLPVAVIGHTGRGNYGHGLDVVWKKYPETELVAVADANPDGLQAAKKRLGVSRGFTDYREMLEATRPAIVAVCPRHPDQHHDMIMAAVRSGCRGIYVEKPFCRTPAEADDIVQACRSNNVKLAVAHRNRYHPVLPVIRQMMDNGKLGRILEIRGRGKGDRRGGAEDLWVLGSHVLNLIHYFGGAPRRCSAVLLKEGRRVRAEDVAEGDEALGPLAGDELHARYLLEDGMVAYFDSVANDGTNNAGFGLQLIGSRGIIDISCDRHPLAYLVPGNPFRPAERARPWQPISTAGVDIPEPRSDLPRSVSTHRLAVDDLVQAIRHDRDPRCDARQGAMTVEMICGAFASHRENSRAVSIPLKFRGNALEKLTGSS